MARLIDADALRKRFEVARVDCLGMEPTFTDDEVKDAIDSAPTIDPVRHGRWKPDTAFGNDIMSGGRMVLCSRCGKGVMTGPVPYCPWCGAKMEGES